MRLKLLAGALIGLFSSLLQAGPEQQIRVGLAGLDLPFAIQAISESPMPGLYQVQMDNGRLLYASADGQFLIQGTLFDLSGERPRNLTAEVEAKAVAGVLAALPTDELVVFSPDQPKTHITVFTDVDCGYCRKLHEEIDELMSLGIEVRYASFVRAGLGSPTAEVMQSIWCAEDRKDAMTRAKQGKRIPKRTCDNPLERQLELGSQIGVQGTPAIFTANGTLIPGYKPAGLLARDALANQ